MYYLNEAYKQALKAMKIDEVPVGAIIVKDNKIIARAYNKKEITKDPLGHCELIAIKKACKKLNAWRLIGCDIYVTLEPCMMCLGALIHARIDNIYYGVKDNRYGAIDMLEKNKFNHVPNAVFLNDKRCGDILSEFFVKKRKEKNGC